MTTILLITLIFTSASVLLLPSHYLCASKASLRRLYKALSGTNNVNASSTANDSQQRGNEDDDFDSETDSDSEDEGFDEDAKNLRKQRRQRLKDLGWFRYFKSFFDLIPDVWPSKNLVLQFAIVAMILQKLSDSVLNVLVHHQESKAINLLWDAARSSGQDSSARTSDFAGSGKPQVNLLPYKEVGLWLLYSFLGPSGILAAVLRPLETQVQWHFHKASERAAFDHVMALSMDYHDDKASYDTLNSMICGTSLYSVLEQIAFDILPILLDLLIAYVYFFYRFDWPMAFLAIFVSLAYSYLTYESSKWIKDSRKAETLARKRFRKVNNESVANWKTIIAFNGTAHQQHLFKEALNEKSAACQRSDLTFLVYHEILSFFTHLGLVAACLLVVHRILNGLNSAGDFIVIVQHWQSIQRPLKHLASTYKYIRRDLTELERFFNLMLQRQTVTDKAVAKPLVFKKGQVEFLGVDFFYKPDKVILKDLNFVAEAGKTVALVGETGGGKSTTIKLLPRFYDVCNGSIMIDGQDLRDVTQESLRDVFGIVPQNPRLFNKSIMDNVRYGRLDATDEEVYDACRAAAIHDKIMTFTKGYQSKVGEGGVRLSGGELQRISIARTIIKQPKIVLLDEATSAVDTETEKKIQEGLRKLCAGRTTFIVAHRLSTIMHADMILVIDNGHIVEQGTHDALIGQGGRYANLVKKQFGMGRLSGSSTNSTAQNSQLERDDPASDDDGSDYGRSDAAVDKTGSDTDDSGVQVN
ncbi:MAG: hypothetical protein Q9165_001069 [Trypethelium subeluteriae]